MAPVSFMDAIRLFFTRYADFGGRSRRSEFWWAVLFINIVNILLSEIIPDYDWIWSLAILVPTLALEFRRLHDVGKSGWWILWSFLPVIGWIILLVQYCKISAEDNQWGPSPLY